MSSISDKLTYLNTTKEEIKTALNNMGGTITNEPFRSYVSKISDVYTNWTKVEGEDTTLSLSPTKKGLMKLDLKGNTQQNGTPTPDTPIPVQVVSGDNTIKVEGKNLINISNINGNLNNSYYGEYVLDFTLEEGITYTLSLDVQVSVTPFWFSVGCGTSSYIKDIRQIGYLNNGRNSITFTPTSTQLSSGTKLFMRCPRYLAKTTATYTLSNIQLELGSTATTYEPYQSTSYPVNLGNIELCKIEDYKDKIYKENDKWYLYKAIGKVVLKGNASDGEWYSNGNHCQLTIFSNKGFISNSQTYSNNFKSVVYSSSNLGLSIYQSGNTSYLRINKGITQFGNITAFKTWLSNNNTTVYYALNEPTTTEITDSNLIGQLDNLEAANSYTDNTYIISTNSQENAHFIISASALKKKVSQ